MESTHDLKIEEPKKGAFVPAFIGFQERGKSNRDQAKEILDHVMYYHLKYGYTKVGITYSANNDQTEEQIYRNYFSDLDKENKKKHPSYINNKWKLTNVGGTGQAAVMEQVEILLNDNSEENPYRHLRKIFFILPITTCAKPSGEGAVKNDWLIRDMANLESFITKGRGLVLGWQNEVANQDANKKYAVGGGMSRLADATAKMEDGTLQDDWVQTQLIQKATDHKNPNLALYKPTEKPAFYKPAERKFTEISPNKSEKPKSQAKQVSKKNPKNEDKLFIPAKPLLKPSLQNTSNSFFHTKPAPDSAQVVRASKDLVNQIRQNRDVTGVSENSDFIIRKGNSQNTFKVAFSNAKDAEKFHKYLRSLDFLEKKDISYYGEEEKYHMNASGFVEKGGAYRYIVRFEVPEKALKYLQSIHVNNAEELFKQVMVDNTASNSLRKSQ